MRRWVTMTAALAAAAVIAMAVTVNGSLQVLGTLSAAIVDFTGAASTAPMKAGTSLPGTCSVGQAYFKTDAEAGKNIHLCTAANTWTQVHAGSGNGTMDPKPDSRYVSLKAEFAGVPYNETTWYEGGFRFIKTGTNNFNNPSGANGDFLDGGYLGFSTTSTANSMIRLYSLLAYQSPSSNNASIYGRTNYPWELKLRFRIPPSSTLTNTAFMAGLTPDLVSDPPGAGVGVRYLDGSDTTLKFWVSGTLGVWGTVLDTGVPADTNWHTLKIRSDGNTQYRMWMSLDGGAEVDICPSGCAAALASSWGGAGSQPLTAQFWLKTADAAQKIMQVDYVSFWLDRGAER